MVRQDRTDLALDEFVLLRVILAGAKFVNAGSSRRAESNAHGQRPTQRGGRGRFAMTGVHSKADVQQAAFGALAKKLPMSVAIRDGTPFFLL
jgi:hypothetical protein